MHCAGKPGAKLGVGAKTAYGAPQFRVLHWAKAPRGSGTIWCDVPDPLPGLPAPYAAALEKLFGVKPVVKPVTGTPTLSASLISNPHEIAACAEQPPL